MKGVPRLTEWGVFDWMGLNSQPHSNPRSGIHVLDRRHFSVHGLSRGSFLSLMRRLEWSCRQFTSGLQALEPHYGHAALGIARSLRRHSGRRPIIHGGIVQVLWTLLVDQAVAGAEAKLSRRLVSTSLAALRPLIFSVMKGEEMPVS